MHALERNHTRTVPIPTTTVRGVTDAHISRDQSREMHLQPIERITEIIRIARYGLELPFRNVQSFQDRCQLVSIVAGGILRDTLECARCTSDARIPDESVPCRSSLGAEYVQGSREGRLGEQRVDVLLDLGELVQRVLGRIEEFAAGMRNGGGRKLSVDMHDRFGGTFDYDHQFADDVKERDDRSSEVGGRAGEERDEVDHREKGRVERIGIGHLFHERGECLEREFGKGGERVEKESEMLWRGGEGFEESISFAGV